MTQHSQAPIWEQAPMMRFLAALLTGILMYDAFAPKEIAPSVILLGCSISFVLYVLLSLKNQHRLFSSIVGLFSVALMGFSICYGSDSRQRNDFWGKQLVAEQYSLVVVSAEPITKNKTTKYEVAALKSIDSHQVKESEGKAFLYVFKTGKETKFKLGDTFLLPNTWKPINNSGNPFELNYQQQCARKGIYFQQFMDQQKIRVYATKNNNSFSLIQRTHNYGIRSIQQNIKDSNTSALLKAMLLGDERDIDPSLREAYSDTGIIHIISISGAHVGILFAAISALFGLINNKKIKWVQLWLSLGIVWFYVLMSGASTPALRAAIMFSIMAIGAASQQQANPLNQLLSAAFVLLLFNPMWLFTIGFQLSFIAVLSLIIFYPSMLSLLSSNTLKKKSNSNRFFEYCTHFLKNAIAASLAAEILVAPLVAYYFHSFPPMFIVANVLASLAMTIVLILGMLLLLFAPISPIAHALASILIFITQAFHRWISYLQQINLPLFKTIHLSALDLVLMYIIVFGLTCFWLLKSKKGLWIGLFALFAFSIQHVYTSWQIAHQKGIIVYHQKGEGLIESYKGRGFTIINGATTESFAQKKAHIGLHLKNEKTIAEKAACMIRGQKIVVLRSEDRLPDSFPIDILILASARPKVDVHKLHKIFRPKKIVLANNPKAYAIKDWEAQCAIHKIALHNIQKDGAFILP
jgi:competence protein ComEC